MNIYQAAGAGLLGFLTLSWILSRPVLHLQGGNFWSLFGGLAVLGTMGAAAIVWFRRAPAAESSQPAGKGGGKDEIHALDALIREAESLKGENLGVMPIFFVIGETGSIKTTTIEQSGIEAELLAGQVYQDNTVVPTRLANIWFARQFLFVEAGGSLLNDPARWQRLIRRLQPGKLRSVMNPSAQPPRAAIVCVDAAKFLQAKARESNEALARTLNARLSEISQILGVRFPVYVIFTRMDGVTFFPEFVRNLGNDESVEVFGATLPMAAATGVYAEEQTRILSSAYDDLFRSLADKRPDVLSREHDAANIPCAYEFPREFRKMRSGVTRFLVDACRPSQLRPSPFLRGFYFSGVRPVTVMDAAPAPSRRVQPEISEASEATSFFYAGGAPVEAPAAPAPAVIARRVPQWLFLRKLFAEVLLRDESAMGTSGSSAKTGRERRVLLACAAAIALVLCAGLIWSFTGNRALESRILEARILEAPRAAREDLPKLEALRIPVEQLRVWEKNRPPMGMRWGLYAGNGLLDPALRTYFHRFFGPVLFQPVAADLSAQLQGLRPVASPGGCADPAYDALKAYLITTSHPEKSSGWLATYLLNRWAEPRRMDSETRDLAARQFAFYAKELPIENPFPYTSSEASDPAVTRARYYLQNCGGFDYLYRMKLDEASRAASKIDFNTLFPQPALKARSTVDGAFTKAGFAAMQTAIRKGGATGEEWVLGKTAEKGDPVQLAQQIEARYRKDYIEAWRKFLRESFVVPYAGIGDAAQKLGRLAAGNQSPLLALFSLVTQNTAVDPEIARAFQAPAAVVPASKGYMDALLELQLVVEQAAKNPDPANPMIAQSQMKAVGARGAALQLAGSLPNDVEGKLNDTVRKLLLDPITHAEGRLQGSGAGEVNKKGEGFCADFRAALLNKYPFRSESKIPAALADVTRIFQPGTGAFWALIDPLKPLIQNGTLVLNPAFARFSGAAETFGRAIYSNGGPQPRLNFTLTCSRIENADGIALTMGAQTLNATAGKAASQEFSWPAQEVKLTAKRGGVTYDWPQFSGPWAVFDFFADAEPGSNFEWKLKSGKSDSPMLVDGKQLVVHFDVNMMGGPPVFQRGYFSGLNCVSKVVK